MAIARTCLETYLAAALCIWISLDAEKLSPRTSAEWESALAAFAVTQSLLKLKAQNRSNRGSHCETCVHGGKYTDAR